MSAARRKCIFVLGMHRSGTSAMAGLLAHLGLPLGKELMAANEFNKKGYFENNRIYQLNERLLGFLGAGWDETFLLEENWIENQDLGKFREELVRIIDEEFSNTPNFVIKDPRICVLLPLYQEVFHSIDIDSQYIIMVRHPEEIWLSLARREQFPRNKSHLLWVDHMVNAERLSRGKTRIFVHFTHLLDNWKDVVEKVIEKLGISIQSKELSSELSGFIEPGLRHYEIDEKNLWITGESSRNLYGILMDLCREFELPVVNNAIGRIDDRQQSSSILTPNMRLIALLKEKINSLKRFFSQLLKSLNIILPILKN